MSEKILSLIVLSVIYVVSIVMMVVTLFHNHWGLSLIFFIITCVSTVSVVLQFEECCDEEEEEI